MPILISTISAALFVSSLAVSAPAANAMQIIDPEADAEVSFADAGELLLAIAEHDKGVDSLTGTIRFTTINALENDRQQRIGNLSIQRDEELGRLYAVSFQTLLIDDRQEIVDERYIFDGRWFVEKLPEEMQFNKRELVPEGQKLDPMELMRDAPFWVSLGQDQDRLLASYDTELLPATQGLIENEDFPELRFLGKQMNIADAVQILLTPKPGSGFEDDWEWVRIWINPETLNPVLYIKAEWTGDLQIVELFGVKSNTEIAAEVFDTSTPDARDGWGIQISNWRGKE